MSLIADKATRLLVYIPWNIGTNLKKLLLKKHAQHSITRQKLNEQIVIATFVFNANKPILKLNQTITPQKAWTTDRRHRLELIELDRTGEVRIG